MKRFAIIAVALLAAVPLTRLAADLTVASVRSTIDRRLRDELGDAIKVIESDFAGIRQDLLDRARAVAEDQDALFLVRTEFVGRETPEAVEEATTSFQQQHSASGPTSVELYGPGLTLRAWSGASILPKPDYHPTPVDTAIRVEEDPFRKALVAWMPVGNEGFVRAAHAIETSTLEAAFRGYTNLADRWQDATGHQLRISFGEEAIGIDKDRFTAVPLQNSEGEVLGTVVISKSSGAGLIRSVEERFEDAEAFWWTLLLVWLLVGLWQQMERRAGERRLSQIRLLELVGARILIVAGLRYSLLILEVPGRWFEDGPLASLFDPVHLASEFGWGIARSVGDLAITGLFLFVASLAVFDGARRYRPKYNPKEESRWAAAVFLSALAGVSLITGAIILHAELTRQSMLDTTLDFFAWTGLSPQPLVLVVFCALTLSTIATLITGIATLIWLARWIRLDIPEVDRSVFPAATVGAVLAAAILFVALDLGRYVPWWSVALHVAAMIWPAHRYLTRRPPLVRALRVRSILGTILVAAVLLYPLLYAGMDEQRRLRLLDAAADFATRGDAQAIVGFRSALEQISNAPETAEILRREEPPYTDDRLVRQLATRYPLVDMIPGIRRARVALYNQNLRLLAGFEQNRRSAFSTSGTLPLPPLNVIEVEAAPDEPIVEIIRNSRSKETKGYLGSSPVRMQGESSPSWVVVELERRGVQSPLGSLFGYLDWRRSLSLAEFQNGRRVRSEGENFERYVLPPEIEDRIDEVPEIWRKEEVYGRAYLSYYRQVRDHQDLDGDTGRVIAVRAPAIIPYDHLYYLLRIAIAGLWLGVPAYLLGIGLRWRSGLIPARRRQYGDRVLDAFLIVGILAVAAMGMVGQQVITRENEGAIHSRLQRRLQRVENALVRAAGPDEALFEVQRRIPLDSLAGDLGLDLAVYHGPWLVATSTPISDAGPLMGYRLPAQAYDEMFIRRIRQAFVESRNQYGEVFTIGYKALSDADGWPQSVIAVLTFPEQARIREERARTTAYFFGALLLLLLVIMATATTLARALTGPLRRLRDGMQSVAAGRVQKPIPVESKDEVGELVETFNIMQDQLSESRRKLAQQERELAWTEMARQVAHEIKNPLTPMKLSIQHLQRAYEQFDSTDKDSKSRFGAVFDRITRTVSEQIGTLAEIANEFSTFARLPNRHLETVDTNVIIREAVELSGAELKSGILLDETPGPVYVNADSDELRRVFINLLKNAVQSVDADGTVEVTTRVTVGLDGNPNARVVLCEVKDDGPGIEPEVQSKIFQPNFSTKTSGMGLGLAISKKSVEAIGGEIGFTTELGEGSTFWIKLPLVDG